MYIAAIIGRNGVPSLGKVVCAETAEAATSLAVGIVIMLNAYYNTPATVAQIKKELEESAEFVATDNAGLSLTIAVGIVEEEEPDDINEEEEEPDDENDW